MMIKKIDVVIIIILIIIVMVLHHQMIVQDSSSNDLRDNYDDDDEQDEASASYAAQVEHLQEYEEALFDSCQDILINKEPIVHKTITYNC